MTWLQTETAKKKSNFSQNDLDLVVRWWNKNVVNNFDQEINSKITSNDWRGIQIKSHIPPDQPKVKKNKFYIRI